MPTPWRATDRPLRYYSDRTKGETKTGREMGRETGPATGWRRSCGGAETARKGVAIVAERAEILRSLSGSTRGSELSKLSSHRSVVLDKALSSYRHTSRRPRTHPFPPLSPQPISLLSVALTTKYSAGRVYNTLISAAGGASTRVLRYLSARRGFWSLFYRFLAFSVPSPLSTPAGTASCKQSRAALWSGNYRVSIFLPSRTSSQKTNCLESCLRSFLCSTTAGGRLRERRCSLMSHLILWFSSYEYSVDAEKGIFYLKINTLYDTMTRSLFSL